MYISMRWASAELARTDRTHLREGAAGEVERLKRLQAAEDAAQEAGPPVPNAVASEAQLCQPVAVQQLLQPGQAQEARARVG